MATPSLPDYASNPGTVRHVQITPIYTGGTKIADVVVNGVRKDLRAPNGCAVPHWSKSVTIDFNQRDDAYDFRTEVKDEISRAHGIDCNTFLITFSKCLVTDTNTSETDHHAGIVLIHLGDAVESKYMQTLMCWEIISHYGSTTSQYVADNPWLKGFRDEEGNTRYINTMCTGLPNTKSSKYGTINHYFDVTPPIYSFDDNLKLYVLKGGNTTGIDFKRATLRFVPVY